MDVTLRRLGMLVAALMTTSFIGCGGGSAFTNTVGPTGASSLTQSAIPSPLPGTPLPLPTASSGNTTSSMQEMPSVADAFVDSIGVNVHMTYANTFYANAAMLESSLTTLGVRHYRDGANVGNQTTLSVAQRLAADGLKFDMLSTEGQDVSPFIAWIEKFGSAADAVEGPNEFDLSSLANWPTLLGAYQSTLNASVRSGTSLAVIGPSLSQATSFGKYLSSSAGADYGNMHDYFAGRNPGTAGFGAADLFGTYGSLSWNIGIAGQVTPGKPMISTETGFSDAVDQYALPAAIKARYVVRTFLEHWNAHVARTYLVELADEGSAPFSHYGLVDASGVPKPAYTALKNLIAHCADVGPAFPVSPLAYSISGSVHHTLLQRRNGAYILVLWVEQQEYDVNSGTASITAAQNVTLTFAAKPASLAQSTFADDGSLATSALTAGTKVALAVTGAPTMVDITP